MLCIIRLLVVEFVVDCDGGYDFEFRCDWLLMWLVGLF